MIYSYNGQFWWAKLPLISFRPFKVWTTVILKPSAAVLSFLSRGKGDVFSFPNKAECCWLLFYEEPLIIDQHKKAIWGISIQVCCLKQVGQSWWKHEKHRGFWISECNSLRRIFYFFVVIITLLLSALCHCNTMIQHHILVSTQHSSSKVVITVKLLPWLRYLEYDSHTAICKNWPRDKFITCTFDRMSSSQARHPFFYSISRFLWEHLDLLPNYKQNTISNTHLFVL